MDKQHILDEIRRIARENEGSPPGIKAFSNTTGIRESDWREKPWNAWNNFGDILVVAGSPRNEWTPRFDEKLLMEKLIGLIRELGRYPLQVEIKRKAATDATFPHVMSAFNN